MSCCTTRFITAPRSLDSTRAPRLRPQSLAARCSPSSIPTRRDSRERCISTTCCGSMGGTSNWLVISTSIGPSLLRPWPGETIGTGSIFSYTGSFVRAGSIFRLHRSSPTRSRRSLAWEEASRSRQARPRRRLAEYSRSRACASSSTFPGPTSFVTSTAWCWPLLATATTSRSRRQDDPTTGLCPMPWHHIRASRVASVPEAREDEWKDAATDFRTLVDCGHYLESPFFEAEKLRSRAFRAVAQTLTGERTRHLTARCPSCGHKLVDGEFGTLRPALGDAAGKRLVNLARLIERAIPSDPGRERFLQDERPDVLLVSPLVRFGSEQADWVKSAQALGIPVGFPVFSWDNLTTKGIVHVRPDRVFVWNEVQKREATEYYDIPPDSIVVTGAPRFDSFIELTPSVDRSGDLSDSRNRSGGAHRHVSLLLGVRRRPRGRIRRKLDRGTPSRSTVGGLQRDHSPASALSSPVERV